MRGLLKDRFTAIFCNDLLNNIQSEILRVTVIMYYERFYVSEICGFPEIQSLNKISSF